MSTSWMLGRAAALAFVLAGGCALWWGWAHEQATLRALWGRRVTHYNALFRRLWWRPRGAQLVAGECSLALLAAVAWFNEAWLGVMPLVAVAGGVPAYLNAQLDKRVEAVEAQLESWRQILSSALRATPSLGEALESCVPLVDAPLRSELELAVREYRLGTPLDEALDGIATRVDSPLVRTAVTAVRVARNSGGNLAETLLSLASALREIARLEAVLRAKTAEGRSQAWAISALPIPLYGGIRAMSPEFFVPLETTPTGHLVIAGAVALWVAAAVSARIILAVEV